ncbi:MAG TPA: hypothetical protein PKZ20_14010, partial [Rhodocyclaceae bacterium]|nr:hypothetical protein [Rhodocyclaceae bacterium]
MSWVSFSPGRTSVPKVCPAPFVPFWGSYAFPPAAGADDLRSWFMFSPSENRVGVLVQVMAEGDAFQVG